MIQRLASDHSPDISEVISDPRLIKWSCRLLEVMRYHFTETLVTKASQTLPTHISDLLDAEHQAKIDAARHDARAEAKRLYHTELTHLQANALAEADKDFETWKSTTLIPEYQAKEASAKAATLQELDAFKHGIAIELEEHKENAHLVAAKSLVLSKTESRSRRQAQRADPTRTSRSMSRARSPSPSPSPSQKKLDKTPTKADFQVSSQNSSAPLCAPVSDHAWGWAGPSVAQEVLGPIPNTLAVGPLSGPGIAKAPVGTLGDADSGLPSTLTSCLPEALPAAAPPVSLNDVPDVTMALAAPSGDARPSSAQLVSSPNVALADSGSPPKVSLVERYPSVTLSPTPPPAEMMEKRLVCILGLTITASLAPIKSSVEDIGSRLRAVETANAAWGADLDDNTSLGIGRYNTGYDIPPEDEECVDYHVASALSRAEEEDAEMADARRRFESHGDDKSCHPFFELVILTARNQTRTEIDPTQLATLADMAAEDWDDFCSVVQADRLQVPPIDIVRDAFVSCTRMWLVKAQLEEDLTHTLCAACGSPAPPGAVDVTNFIY